MNSNSLDNLPLHRRLRDARRAKSLTQSQLAAQVGCQQSALSMLESGKMDALAGSTISKIAEILEISLESEDGSERKQTVAGGLRICANNHCPSNVPYQVGDEILFWPRPQSGGANHCVFCGEVLERSCPGCCAPIAIGACCAQCGTPYTAKLESADKQTAWVRQRQDEIQQWRGLIGLADNQT